MKKNQQLIKRMSFVAIFAALSALLYTIVPKFSLPIFPVFLEVNFSMIPIVICAFMLGPVDGAICVLVRFLIKLPATSTMCVGETADFLIGLPVALGAGLMYHKTNFKHKELYAFLLAFGLWVLMGIITNACINIPFYSAVIPGGMDAIIWASSSAFRTISGGAIKEITTDNFMFYYLLCAVLPFNVLLASIVLIVTWPIHKRLKILYDMVSFGQNHQSDENAGKK